MLGLTAREEQRRSAGRASTGLARQFTWRNAGLGGFAAVLFWSMLAVFVSSNRARTSGDIAAVSGTHVAVLPFQNQGDSADNYIVDGIADEIRGKLARINGLTVIASNSSAQYRNSTLPPASVASQLGANYLLQGRVRWAGGDQNRRVQVVAELVDGRSGATTWQQTFEAPLTDVFEVQSQIASRVAGALGTQLGTRDARELARRPTVSPAAWDAYLKGKAITAVDPTSMRVAAGFFEQAVALDSSFVEAWAGLSFSMARVFYNGGRELRAAVRSREAMERAIAADPNAAQGYAAQALYYTNVDPNPSRSSEALATALRLAPNDPEVLASAGRADVNTGRLDAGVERLQRARELDPRSIAVLSDLLRALVSAGLFREAIEVGDAAVALSPSDPGVYEFIVMAQIALGDFDAARAVTRRAINNGVSPPTLAAYFSGFFEMSWVLEDEVRAVIPRLTPAAFDGDRAWWGQALSTHHWLQGNRAAARAYADSALAPSLAQITGSPDNPSVQVLYALMLAYTGAKDSAVALGRRAIQQYQGTQTRSFASAYDRLQLIRTYLAVGEFDAAIDELQIRLQQGGPITREWLRLDPTFAPLRGNPRFERLVSGG